MVIDVDLVTLTVLTVKVAFVLPAATVTLAGTVLVEELSLSDTTTPPLGAALPNVTVPREVAPPTTLVGLRVRAVNVGALMVRVAVFVTPP